MGKKKSRDLTVPELRKILQVVLPFPPWQIAEVLKWLAWQHGRKREARKSHYKRWEKRHRDHVP